MKIEYKNIDEALNFYDISEEKYKEINFWQWTNKYSKTKGKRMWWLY